MACSVTDKKGRNVLHINSQGKVALARYKDLSGEEIDALAKMYNEITGKSIEDALSFLKFEDKEKFCS